MYNVMHTPAELNAKVKPKQGKVNPGEESATGGNDTFFLYNVLFLACFALQTFSADWTLMWKWEIKCIQYI